MAGETITVFEHACRYLMDVNDVYMWLTPLINTDNFNNSVININLNNKITINELLNIFENLLKLKIKRTSVQKGVVITRIMIDFYPHLFIPKQ